MTAPKRSRDLAADVRPGDLVLHLRPLPSAEGEPDVMRRLAQLLKTALRRHGMRCLETFLIEEDPHA